MKVQITYNGKTVDVELTTEQMKELGLRNNNTGWERVENGSIYHYINNYGEIRSVMAENNGLDKGHRKYGNYFSDPSIGKTNGKSNKLISSYAQMGRRA